MFFDPRFTKDVLMSRSPISVGAVNQEMDATHIAAGKDHLLWVTGDGRLCRTGLESDKPADDVETLADSWPNAPFAIVGDYVVGLGADGGLTSYEIVDNAIGEGAGVALDVQVTDLAGSGTWLYFADDAQTLRRVALEDGVAAGDVSVVSEEWRARHFALSGDRICWVDEGNRLWLGSIEEGRLSPSTEAISDEWNSDIFTAQRDQLLWVDAEGSLKRAKKLAGNGNYIHFYNDGALSWDQNKTHWINANVRGPGEVGYYNCYMTAGSQTGVPYEPKHQDYWYRVEFVAEVHDNGKTYLVRAFMPDGAYFKVEDRSKRAVLVREAGASPDNMVVKIEDM
jgi:hypothetical protein